MAPTFVFAPSTAARHAVAFAVILLLKGGFRGQLDFICNCKTVDRILRYSSFTVVNRTQQEKGDTTRSPCFSFNTTRRADQQHR